MNWHRLAWFDVHRARFWQMVCAAVVVAAFTGIVAAILLASFQL